MKKTKKFKRLNINHYVYNLCNNLDSLHPLGLRSR
nr:MAG TPA: hypothetical protein [Caudoviricetes sp.]